MKGRRNKLKRKPTPKWVSLDDAMEALDAEFEGMRKTHIRLYNQSPRSNPELHGPNGSIPHSAAVCRSSQMEGYTNLYNHLFAKTSETCRC
jgi:hypothetical protein